MSTCETFDLWTLKRHCDLDLWPMDLETELLIKCTAKICYTKFEIPEVLYPWHLNFDFPLPMDNQYIIFELSKLHINLVAFELII